jgi:hypothetical protein
MTTAGNNSDERNTVEVLGLIGGVGVVLLQAAALIPGLLPLLILFLPLILPLIVLGFAAAVVIAVPFGIWRLTALLLRPVRSRAIARQPGAFASFEAPVVLPHLHARPAGAAENRDQGS